MKQIILFSLLLFSFTSYTQTKKTSKIKLLSVRYAGVYGLGNDIEKGRIGTICIYPETNDTVLFYIELNRGAPSYNMGSLYGRVKIINDNGTFYNKFDYANDGCKWTFTFAKKSLTIKTIDGQYDCGFGHHVFADGKYKRTTNKIENSFIDLDGTEVYFDKTKPEEYNK